MSGDPFNLNGQAVAADLVRVMAERDRFKEATTDFEREWIAQKERAEAAEQQLADLRASITALAEEWEADDRASLDRFGQHQYATVIQLAGMLRDRLPATTTTTRHDALLVEFLDAALGDETGGRS